MSQADQSGSRCASFNKEVGAQHEGPPLQAKQGVRRLAHWVGRQGESQWLRGERGGDTAAGVPETDQSSLRFVGNGTQHLDLSPGRGCVRARSGGRGGLVSGGLNSDPAVGRPVLENP